MSYWREVVEGSDYHLKSQEWEDLLSELEELQAGAASRDAEVAELKSVPMKYRRMAFNAQLQDEVVKLEKENNQLRAQINVLRDALDYIDSENASEEVLRRALQVLTSTPEQSLAEYRNKVIEECAAVLNVAITRLSSCGASIKNDVAISTLKEQSCRLRAMKEQP